MKRVLSLLQIFVLLFVSSCSNKSKGTPVITGKTATGSLKINTPESFLLPDRGDPKVLEDASTFIQEKSYELYTRSPVIKPISCPVLSLKNSDILAKITLIKDSIGNKCARNADLLNRFAAAAANISLMSGGSELGTASILFSKNISEKIDLTTLLYGLSSLTNKKECVEDLTSKGGAINAVAELALQFSQLGLLFPRTKENSQGVSVQTVGPLIAAGGLVFGFLTTLISQVLTGHYDWKLEKDRTAFINLNCAYFELRKQVEKAGLHQHNEAYSKKKIEQYEEALNLALTYERSIEVERGEIFKDFDEIKENFIKSQLSEDKRVLYHSLNKLNDAISLDKEIDKNLKRTLLLEFAKSAPVIEGSLKQYSKEARKTSRSANLDFIAKVKRIARYSSDEVINNQGQDDLDAIEKYYSTDGEDFLDLHSSFTTHSRRILEDISEDYLASEEQWRKIKTSNISNGDSYDELKSEYAVAQLDLKNLKDYYSAQLKILNSFLTKENYVFHDDGDMNSFNIRLLQEHIDSILYGREAKRFLKYITKSAKNKLDHFVEQFKLSEFKFKEKFQPREKSARKFDSCNAAVKLEDNYLLAQEAAEVGSDFVFTNIHIFHPLFNKKRKFLIFKIGESNQSKIYRHAQTVMYVNKDRYSINFSGEELTQAKKFMEKDDTLGYQIKRIRSYSEHILLINNFIQSNNCRDTLRVLAN